jgi:tRNA(fMet)-specific endonuclease VapC
VIYTKEGIAVGQQEVVRRVVAVPMTSLCISAITEGELHFGLPRRPGARRLHLGVREFLRRVDRIGWDTRAAERSGEPAD